MKAIIPDDQGEMSVTKQKVCKDCSRARRTPRGAHYCEKNQRFVARKFWCEYFHPRDLHKGLR